MNSSDIRSKFLKYFEQNGHRVLPSSSLIPKDPTVLLTVAGMLQFKPIFLGIEKAQYPRAATIQKCIRTNDIENVGKTSRHHTFFEMLGNFSFGDYFKKEAIAFAWELITQVLNIDKSRLYYAVYEKDYESEDIWLKDIGIQGDRIVRLGEDNNFWAAGPTGPCGPCSEIYYDLGDKYGCSNPNCSPGCDCDRFLEIWNLVFMEFNRSENGSLSPLPKKNIDTGMGLERIASVLQGKTSNFDTDLFIPIINAIKASADHDGKNKVASINLIADHIRAITHLMKDGVLPGNEGRNYILRRIIRRAILHGQKIGIRESFLYKLCDAVFNLANDFYPTDENGKDAIQKNILLEEENFSKTMADGAKMLDGVLGSSKDNILSGKDIFKLYDTYGFPYELTKEIAKEKGFEVDLENFKVELGKQKSRSREGSSKTYSMASIPQISGYPKTEFVGYENLEIEADVLGVEDGFIILDKTPFYVEGGGQISDQGYLIIERNKFEVEHLAKTSSQVVLHKIKMDIIPSKGEKIRAEVNSDLRNMIERHHTGTHLLHAALQKYLGAEVTQKGSFVSSERFRFDFAYPKSVDREVLDKIEHIINDWIKGAYAVEKLLVSLDEARRMGAIALFGEKYGDKVRVVKIENISMELCGGTHVKNTEDIGLFKIIKESAIASGVRRIEAVCGKAAEEFIQEKQKSEADLIRIRQIKESEEQKQALQEKEALNLALDMKDKAENINGAKIILLEFNEYGPAAIKKAAQTAKEKISSSIIVFISVFPDRIAYVAVVSADLLQKGFNAGVIIKELSKIVDGKGGGRADIAQGGGKNILKTDEIFAKLKRIIKDVKCVY